MAITADFSELIIGNSNNVCTIRYFDNSTPTPGCWLWTFPSNGTIVSNTKVDEQGPHDVEYPTNEGPFEVTLKVGEQGSNCCPAPPCDCEFTVDFTANNQGGSGCVYDFVPTKTVVKGELVNCRYAWDFGDGTTSSEESPSHEFFGCANYDVTLTVNCGCCTANDMKTVTCGTCTDTGPVIGSIDIGQRTDNTFCWVCFGAPLGSECPIVSWEWKIDGVIESTLETFCKSYLPAEDGDQHFVELTVTDSSGCTTVKSKNFVVECSLTECGGCSHPSDTPQAFPVAIISGIPDTCFGSELNKSHTLTTEGTPGWCLASKIWNAHWEGHLYRFQIQSSVGVRQALTDPKDAHITVNVRRVFVGFPDPVIFDQIWTALGIPSCVGTHSCSDMSVPNTNNACDSPHNSPYPDAILDIPG